MAKLTMHEEYANTPLPEITRRLKPVWLAFANTYLANNNNALGAYRTIYNECKDIKRLPKDGIRKDNENILASRANYILRKTIVSAYILKTQAKRADLAVVSADRSYEAWISTMGDLRDDAAEAGQYSPSVRAHEIIGKADGHIDSTRTDQMHRVSNDELVAKVAGILGQSVQTLDRVLHGDKPRIVEGEIVTGIPTIGETAEDSPDLAA
jgi:hypothetical protein